MNRYAIGLGSNLGDRLDHLIGARRELRDQIGEPELSALYETAPVGGPDQDPYLNAVAVVETDLGPLDVLNVCQEIELAHGRERKTRWGPRTLDLDVIASDAEYSHERLVVPHQRAAEREFVLRPLVDVWPDAPVGGGLNAEEALSRVGGQGVDRLAEDWIPPVARWRANALLAGQFGIIVAVALGLAYDGSLPEGEVDAVRLVGSVVAFVGVVLAFISSRRLGGSMTASPIPRPDTEMVTGGPYRYARHPIYGGLSLFMIGTALILDSTIGFLLALTLIPFFIVKAGYEERQLRMRFAGYLLYKETVPRWLIPFVV